MSFLNTEIASIGVTWSPYIRQYFNRHPEYIDYIEVAFEQLRHGTEVADFPIPVILHCASLSVAGFVDPKPTLVQEVSDTAKATNTPWVGEHLAYLSGKSLSDSSKTLTSTFTLAPQLSDQTVKRVSQNWNFLQQHIDVPLILENPPQYFKMPDSNMSMSVFMAEVCDACETGILLDLAHLLISAHNLNDDVFTLLDQIPWDRVVEIHVADGRLYDGVLWDNHASMPNAILWDMLVYSLEHCHPKAITLEYNWLIDYQDDFFSLQVEKIRSMLPNRTLSHAS